MEMEKAVEMMLLDMTFNDAPPSAPRTPPTVLLYGITSEGRRVCCTVNDFLPYFWFPAPIHPVLEEIEEKLGLIADRLNQRILSSSKSSNGPAVAEISLAYRTPLMYYRQGGPFPFLQVKVWRSKLLPLVAKNLASLAERHELRDHGLTWRGTTCYEENIKFGMRFCCDTNIAGGGWVEIQQGQCLVNNQLDTRCDQELRVSWHDLKGSTPDATHDMELPYSKTESSEVAAGSNTRSLLFEVADEDSETDDLTPRTASYGTTSTKPSSLEGSSVIPPLRILALHVQCGCEGDDSQGVFPGRAASTQADVNVDSVGIGDLEGLRAISCGRSAIPSRNPVLLIANIAKLPEQQQLEFIFTYGKHPTVKSEPGVEVRVYNTESEMLIAWQKFVHSELDPDVICLYQLKDSLRYLIGRFKALKLGIVDISRFKRQPTQVKSVVTYGKHWVKQQARMTATSNQEVFRASVEGRIVIDMLRVVLVAYNLSTFTLGECSQVLLRRTKELLSLTAVSKLWKGKDGGLNRIMCYSLQEAQIALQLLERLQTLPETIEMARVTGLAISDVLYKAQMVRVQSLLLRSSCKEGWLLGGPTLAGQLSESPFLLHPREQNTAGLYEDPVCILDFASLYPSVYMAHNLCYTTLVHPDDVKSLPAEHMFLSPTGARFVKMNVRHGILPRICGALITARKRARDRMMAEDTSPEEKSVLDGRQRALKLCSNALYGFTGANASPQQAVPLADSCLSIGAASCRRAVNLAESTFDMAKVVYAQTDSVFVKFQGVTVDRAIDLAKIVAETISDAFPTPIVLKFERVLCPFLLIQVNRYAGKQYISKTQDELNGTLFVRGLESERRDVPLFVRRVCKSALTDILVKRDITAALNGCKHAIWELITGRLSMYELLMTGGLWRVDDNDITRLAVDTKSPRKGRATAEEGRGPHVALAVKLKRKDPDRQFHIGERIPYVLLTSSSKLQDEMAEDPITALAEDLPINVHVYLENKLRKPLESILEHVSNSNQVRELFSGSHTVPPSSVFSSGSRTSQQPSVSSFFRRTRSCLMCRKPVDDEEALLCESCLQDGAEQSMTAVLVAQKMEEEKKFAAHAECLRCHSGGLIGPIVCTSTDCPLFYLRYECKRLEYLESLLAK